ncbi:MAG: DNA mismatch repair protein MutS [Desulfobacterales bacterium]|nr:Smr/MutS family protein [Deltaproteobacteria bacterium]NNL42311.1 DNA mismatch repair protein MutS [Desulfobacterales bacterium]
MMKPTRSSGKFRPFEDLKALLENRSKLPAHHIFNRHRPPFGKKPNPETDPVDDQTLFEKAMADVKPISKKNRIENSPLPKPSANHEKNEDYETLSCLKRLVNSGKGFVVADTPEYIEGAGYKVHPEITKRLHRGDFSIQAHIDLHGLNANDAKSTFDTFLKNSVKMNKKAVMVIHGRGLSSPDRPVLKSKVCEWLSCGQWRKWVMAFSSARLCDGGAGATYILLRQRPLKKQFIKGKRYIA